MHTGLSVKFYNWELIECIKDLLGVAIFGIHGNILKEFSRQQFLEKICTAVVFGKNFYLRFCLQT